MNKYDYDTVKQIFKNNNMILLSKEYHNVKEYLEYKCEKHCDYGIQKITLGNVLRGRYCPYCMYEDGKMPKPIPELIIKEYVEKQGNIYIKSYTEKQASTVEYICGKHKDNGIVKQPFINMRNGKTGCPICNHTNYNTEVFTKDINDIFNNNIEVIGDFTRMRDNIKVRCRKHNYIWSPKAYNLKSGFGCRYCGIERSTNAKRINAEEVINKINTYRVDELVVISEPSEIINSSTRFRVKCKKCGHIWETSYYNLIKENCTGCPRCHGWKTENKMCDIIEGYGYDIIKQKKFSDCKDIQPLPFDCYIDELNMAFEYDGEGHYNPIPRKRNECLGSQMERLIDTRRHDRIKSLYCIDNNIALCRIPYWEKENMEKIISNFIITHL